MADIVLADEQVRLSCEAVRSSWNLAMTLRLFRNDYTPDVSSLFANFTEANFTGYVAWTIGAATFGAASQVVAGQYQSVAGPNTFTCSSGSQTIYGWYLATNSPGNVLRASQRFGSPVTVDSLNPLVLVVKLYEWAAVLL